MRIKDGVTIWFPEGVCIGKHCSINEYCFIDGYGEVKIGNNVRIAHRASIISEDHGYRVRGILIKDQPKVKGMVIIKDDVWIGCNVTILKQVTIGQGAVIGAGSVIRENVPDYAIVAGNPQKVVGYRKS
jgi:acetyltransferase-like isoleucine patch superfamily enzyme